ncbi:MAG: RloB domain-containing protein [Chitinophagaceae bacterium]|nr:RloB domain-containing protein [Chitinophagaceae bacterium]
MAERLKKTLLIVCEGENTEPNYFSHFRDFLIERQLDIAVTISPLPKEEREEIKPANPNAKKRQLKILAKNVEDNLRKFSITEEFSAQPVRYVKEAQLGLEDGTYDEVWAVFDKDGHPRQKEAFELAVKTVNGRRVNIAFNSVSFEEWILLHFEKINKSFNTSQCRQGVEYIACGHGNDDADCHGDNCIGGYIVEHNFIANYSKRSEDLYQQTARNISTAITNCVWLRNSMSPNRDRPIYEINPYCTTDRLIFSLLQFPREFIWFEKGEIIETANLKITIAVADTLVAVTISNRLRTRFVLPANSFCLFDALGTVVTFGKREIVDQDLIVENFDLSSLPDSEIIYIGYQERANFFLLTDR